MRRKTAILYIVLSLALGLRLVTALALPLDYRFSDDAVEYVNDANHLLQEGIFGERSGVPYATIPPGYPLFVAALLWASGGSLMAVRLAQACVATVTVWLVYLLGWRVASERAGILAALALAVYPPWVLWPSLFLTETLFACALMLVALGLVQLSRSPTASRAVVVGVSLGAVTLIRETLIAFPLVLPAQLRWARLRWKTIGRSVPIVLITMMAVWAPWLYRNYATFGVPFFTERTAAIRYMVTGSGYLGPRYGYLADSAAQKPRRKPVEVYRDFGPSGSALLSARLLVRKPSLYFGYLMRRLQRLWLHPKGLVSVPGGVAPKAAYLAVHILLLVLAGVGLMLGVWRREPGMSWLATLLLYATAIPVFLVWPAPRYTLPFVPFLFVAASAVLVAVAERLGYWPVQAGHLTSHTQNSGSIDAV